MEDPLTKLLGDFGIAILVVVVLGISIAGALGLANQRRMLCPRCRATMTVKTNWLEVGKGLLLGAIGVAGTYYGGAAGAPLGEIGREVGTHLGEAAAHHVGAHLPSPGDTTYLWCESCALPNKDARFGCGAFFTLAVVLPIMVGLALCVRACSTVGDR